MSSKLLFGFTLGLVTGLLLAPDKGSASRRKLKRAGRDLKNKFNDFVDNLNDKIETFKGEAEDIASETKFEARSFSSEAGSP
jgi:gas vesicle protein